MEKKSIVLVILLLAEFSYADSWIGPAERLYFSDNKQYIADVIPADSNHPAKVKVFGTGGNTGWINWECNLGNEGTPGQVFVCDEGKYVVTVNENSSRVHGGMGDFVLAFYQKNGLIKNYSLEQILHYPDKIDEGKFNQLIIRTVSGRGWNSMPMLLEQYNGKLYFGIWLLHGQGWLVWDVSTGEEVEANDELIKFFNEKGLQWAREYKIGEQANINYQFSSQALDFLGFSKKDEDKKYLESFLSDTMFHTVCTESNEKLMSFHSYSSRRSQIDKILSGWNGNLNIINYPTEQKYHYLGVVKGILELPRAPKRGDKYLCIYLIPSKIDKSDWFNEVPIHRLCANWSEYSSMNMDWPKKNINFNISGVTPGEYRITAVWDLAKPYNFGDNYIKGLPQEGDYQSIESPVINIKAGEIIEGLKFDCLEPVTASTN